MFYLKLIKLCKKEGVSVTKLVKQLGMSTGNLSKWKNGNVPKMDTIIKISNFFNISTDYFFLNDTVDSFFNDSRSINYKNNISVYSKFNFKNNIFIDDYKFAPHNGRLNICDYFYLSIKDNSMIKSGIKIDSLVLIKKGVENFNGQIVAFAQKDEDILIRRYREENEFIYLGCENDLMINNDFKFKKNDSNYKILGVALEVKTKL
ncbi:MAG: LexA family transcriptional regulator [Oscillospiraceae bacterium]